MARQSRTRAIISVRPQEVPAVPASEIFPRTYIDPKVPSQDVLRLTCATGDNTWCRCGTKIVREERQAKEGTIHSSEH